MSRPPPELPYAALEAMTTEQRHVYARAERARYGAANQRRAMPYDQWQQLMLWKQAWLRYLTVEAIKQERGETMDKPKKPTQRAAIRAARIADINSWVQEQTDHPVALPSLVRLSDQDLHLLAAAIDNSKGVPHE